MAVTVRHAKTNNVPDITQEQLDDGIARGIYAVGTTLEGIVLPSDWNDKHEIVGQGFVAPIFSDVQAPVGFVYRSLNRDHTLCVKDRFQRVHMLHDDGSLIDNKGRTLGWNEHLILIDGGEEYFDLPNPDEFEDKEYTFKLLREGYVSIRGDISVTAPETITRNGGYITVRAGQGQWHVIARGT